MITPIHDPLANHLLAALAAVEYARLRPHLTVVDLPLHSDLAPQAIPIAALYFPLTGIGSVVAIMRDGTMAEVGTIGNEGLIGLSVFHGGDESPFATFVQVTGAFARIPVAAFRQAAAPGTALHALTERYAQAYAILVGQSAACNRLHPIAARCARWLLLTQDRVGLATFPLSHEFLGYMLGVRRASVTVALGILQTAGRITYHRGHITITDRPGLEEAACECYGVITAAFTRLLGDRRLLPPAA